MSVLENNSAKMADILAAVNALPDASGGGSGGGSVETCSVTLTPRGATLGNVTYTRLTNDGEIDTKNYGIVYASGHTFECVCGTMICFLTNGINIGNISADNAEVMFMQANYGCVKIAAPASGTATISVMAAAEV